MKIVIKINIMIIVMTIMTVRMQSYGNVVLYRPYTIALYI